MPGPGSRNFRLLNDLGIETVEVYNNSGGDLEAGDAVYLSSGTLTEVADTNTVGVHGVLADDIDSGEYGAMYIAGVFEVDSANSQDFAQGGAVYAASDSTVDDGSGSDMPLGHIVGENPASGASTVKFVLASLFLHTPDAKA